VPRMQRLESPGSLVHIIGRGIEGSELFRSDEDRLEFLSRFEKHLSDVGYKCITWCLMENHYHLFLRTNENRLSKLMRPLNGGYARWFNKKYTRKGYLFQDRYKSILCQDQDYCLELIRYINLNPVRAGVVKSLSGLLSYKWCGHPLIMGRRSALGIRFQDRMEALGWFGRSEKDAMSGYLDFLREGISEERLTEAGALSSINAFEAAGSFKGWPAVVGDPRFATQAMEAHKIRHHRKHRQADYNEVLSHVADEVCRTCKIEKEDLFRRGRQNARSHARALFAYRLHHEELLPLGVIAGYLRTTLPPIMHLAEAGRRLTGAAKR